MAKRKKITGKTQADLLFLSRRRCCICFCLHGDDKVKKGQIAHLDKNPGNNNSENLVWLCLDHHDQFDSKTSQSKNFTIEEVVLYRAHLYDIKRITDKTLSSENRNPIKLTTGQRVRVVFIPNTLSRPDLHWAKEMDQLCGKPGEIHTVGYGAFNAINTTDKNRIDFSKPFVMLNFDDLKDKWANYIALADTWVSLVD